MLLRPHQRRCLALLLGLMALPLAAAVQSGPAGREVVLTGVPYERPPPVYSTADVPVLLVFDANLAKEPAMAGAEVRRHPSLSNALEVIPSVALAETRSAPLRVPLTNGEVALVLVFGSDKRDHVVRILRRPAIALDAGASFPPVEVHDAFRFTASAVLDEEACRPSEPHLPRVEEVFQTGGGGDVLVCAVGPASYLRVTRRKPECVVSSARLLHGQWAVEVLFLEEEARTCKEGKCQYLAVRSPPEEKNDFELELLAADGTRCEHYRKMTLKPGAP